MAQENWKVKEGVTLTAEEVAKIACALKSLAVYTSLACEHEDDPEDLTAIVQEGLDTIERLFET